MNAPITESTEYSLLIIYWYIINITTPSGSFRRFSTCMRQNARINTVRRVMVSDVYFPFSNILYLSQRDYAHIHSIFKKPKINVFILHLLTCLNIYKLSQNCGSLFKQFK